MTNKIVKGYKVTNSEMQCLGFQFELNKTFTQKGDIEICENGFHFCEQAASCFNYYDFNPKNRVFEVEASGTMQTEGDKSCARKIKFVRELAWEEVLKIVNTGVGNSGFSNSGNRNSGYSNSGNSNSGNSNSGDWNSGNRNSGYSNSGNSNSGDWNSGNRNSGYSNSGYRNSGAFCTDNNPKILLFNKPSSLSVREWEKSKAVELMYQHLEPNIWVDESYMTEDEKQQNPSFKATGGYLKRKDHKTMWADAWNNWSDENKKVFTSLENFDAILFEEITGIKITSN